MQLFDYILQRTLSFHFTCFVSIEFHSFNIVFQLSKLFLVLIIS